MEEELKKAKESFTAGDMTVTQQLCNKIVAIDPTLADAWYMLGVIAINNKKYNDAINKLSHATNYSKLNDAFYIALGAAYKAINNLELARQNFAKAIELNSNNDYYYLLLAQVLDGLGEVELAISTYLGSLKLNKVNIDSANNLGNLYKRERRYKEALDIFEEFIYLYPDNINLQINYAACLITSQTDLEKARNILEEILENNPECVQAIFNLAEYYKITKDNIQALEYYLTVLHTWPTHFDSLYNIATLYQASKNIDDALIYYKKALEIKPECSMCIARLYYLYRSCCSWDKANKIEKILDNLTQNEISNNIKPGEEPLVNIERIDDIIINYNVATLWAKDIESSIASLKFNTNFVPLREYNGKIKIAYISSDFYEHATMHLFMKTFEFYNKDLFDIYVYSYTEGFDSKTVDYIESRVDKFYNVKTLSSIEIAKLIYKDKINILVDLKGYTRDARLDIFGFKPAPIQISYLGFPGTIGGSLFDYIISDKIVSPVTQLESYAEKIIYMPNSYQATDDIQDISSVHISKSEEGLPENKIILATFNQPHKIDEDIFNAWLKVMQENTNTVLWLKIDNAQARINIINHVKEQGVDKDRIYFASHKNKKEHLKRLQLADIILDTRIYNGHTTTTDALYAGVPVITIKGKHFASRVSASLLQSMKLSKLVTYSVGEYIKLISYYCKNKEELDILRQELQTNLTDNYLFNTKKFTQSLEQGYKKAWQNYLDHKIDNIFL